MQGGLRGWARSVAVGQVTGRWLGVLSPETGGSQGSVGRTALGMLTFLETGVRSQLRNSLVPWRLCIDGFESF